jgi:integrase
MLKLPVVVLDKDRVLDIIDRCPLTKAGDRDSDLIAFLYGTGLRISEALRVQKEDIDFEKHTVAVRNGKGGKSRTVAISNDALRAVQDYYNAVQYGQPIWGITPSGIRKRMRLLAKKIGLPRLHAHSIRHAHAVALAKAGVSLNHIQQQLGHSNIGTTSLYLQRYNPEERILAVLDAFKEG